MKSQVCKKFLSVILLLATVSSLLFSVSCNRKYDEDEVLSATKELLAKAEKLNYIYYGEGIKYYDSNDQNGYYRKANIAHLEELGFSNIDELKAITEETFSVEYSNLIYSTILSAVRDDFTVVSAARYYQEYDEVTKLPTDIMVNSAFSPMMRDRVEYNYDSMYVSGVKKEKVFVTVKATVTNTKGDSQITDIVITLIEEENGWRIDNPTYANYNDRK